MLKRRAGVGGGLGGSEASFLDKEVGFDEYDDDEDDDSKNHESGGVVGFSFFAG